MSGVLHDWFGWPNGAVLTNLVASLLWAGVAIHKLFQIHKNSEETKEHAKQAHFHSKAAHEHVKETLPK